MSFTENDFSRLEGFAKPVSYNDQTVQPHPTEFNKIGYEFSSGMSKVYTKILNLFGARKDYFENYGKKVLEDANAYRVDPQNTYSNKVHNVVRNLTTLIPKDDVEIVQKIVVIQNFWETNSSSPLKREIEPFPNPKLLDYYELEVSIEKTLQHLQADDTQKGYVKDMLNTAEGGTPEFRIQTAKLILDILAIDNEHRALEPSLNIIPSFMRGVFTEQELQSRKLLLEIDILTPPENKGHVASLIISLGEKPTVGQLAIVKTVVEEAKKNGNFPYLESAFKKILKLQENQRFQNRDKVEVALEKVSLLAISPQLNEFAQASEEDSSNIYNNFVNDSLNKFPFIYDLLIKDGEVNNAQMRALANLTRSLEEKLKLAPPEVRIQIVSLMQRELESSAIKDADSFNKIINDFNHVEAITFFQILNEETFNLPEEIKNRILNSVTFQSIAEYKTNKEESPLFLQINRIKGYIDRHGKDLVLKYTFLTDGNTLGLSPAEDEINLTRLQEFENKSKTPEDIANTFHSDELSEAIKLLVSSSFHNEPLQKAVLNHVYANDADRKKGLINCLKFKNDRNMQNAYQSLVSALVIARKTKEEAGMIAAKVLLNSSNPTLSLLRIPVIVANPYQTFV